MNYILYIAAVCILAVPVWGQKESKLPRFLRPDPPEYISIDTNQVLIEEEVENDYLQDPFVYDEQDMSGMGKRSDELSGRKVVGSFPRFTVIVDSTDSTVVYDTIRHNAKYVALMEDSAYWINVNSAFNVFDSMSVNPYEVDITKYKDTLAISLYDTIPGVDMRSCAMPVNSCYVTSIFGQRGYRWHYGTDLRLAIGDSVVSAFDGVVRISKYNPGGYGNYVMVRHHNGLETLYGHLTKQLVSVGDHVKAGELIGWGGNTGRSSGPHLHFEVRYQGHAINPQDIFDFHTCEVKGADFVLTPKYFKYIVDRKKAAYHSIRSGDTLSGIAKRYRVSVRQLCRLNGISTKTILRIGRRLRVR